MKIGIKHILGLVLLLPTAATHCRAQIYISPGWDLLHTQTAYLNGEQYKGVDLGTFDFGAHGVHNVGPQVDTIVHRDKLDVPGTSGSIPIEIVGLQLQSVNPYDPDGAGPAPFATYYATLQSRRSVLEAGFYGAGALSLGNLDADAKGTFNNMYFDVNYDLRVGSIGGTIVFSGVKAFGQPLAASGTWQRTPYGVAPLIDGVNYKLNGTDTLSDFWLNAPVLHDAGGGTIHTVASPIPEPASTGAFFGLACLGAAAWRKFHRAQTR